MNKKGTKLIIAGLLLMMAALFITVYNLVIDKYGGEASEAVMGQIESSVETAAQDRLELLQEAAGELESKGLSQESLKDYAIPNYVLNPDMDMPVVSENGHDYIGMIEIPSLSISLPVISEWSYPNLKSAPCRYCGSVYTNDMVIAAHNYKSHFGRLRRISYGDELTFTDAAGNAFKYRCIEVEILQPNEVEYLVTGDWDLTLFTCTLGGRSRTTVRCELVETIPAGMEEFQGEAE